MQAKNVAILVLVTAIISAVGTRYFYPKVTSEIKTETVEKEVIRKDIVTVVKEIVRPDGTKETQTTITDKSREKRDSHESVSIKVNAKPDWSAGIGVSAKVSSLLSKPDYTFQVNRRVLGPAFVGVTYNTNSTVGAHVLVEF